MLIPHETQSIPEEYLPFPTEELSAFFNLVTQYGLDKFEIKIPDGESLDQRADWRYVRVQRKHDRFAFGATLSSGSGVAMFVSHLYYTIYTQPSDQVYPTDVLDRMLLAFIETTFHELTHVTQNLSDRLTLSRTGRTWWKPHGSPVSLPYRRPKSHKQYWDQPWEVEARQNQIKLTSEFIKDFSYDKDTSLSQVFNHLKDNYDHPPADSETCYEAYEPDTGFVLFQGMFSNDPFVTKMNIKENDIAE